LAEYLPSSAKDSSSSPRKIGLYTSPHLRFVRERIQINNEPLSESAFAKYFFEVWDRLEAAARAENQPVDAPGTKPVYFRFLTLMALHAYLQEGVDTAVIECGIGGEYDSTNILASPTVTAITSLGIDHVAMLGSTLPEIAWHKAGIFKPGAAAFTAPQPDSAMAVLRDRAVEKGVHLSVVEPHPELDTIRLGLSADFQKTNASLAIAVAAAHLRALGHIDGIPDPAHPSASPLPPHFRRGLEQVRWPGRCEVRREAYPPVAWHIDGGHTLDSIEVAGRWFAERITASSSSSLSSETKQSRPRILLFNQQTRDAGALARALHDTLATALGSERPFTHAVFCTNVTFRESGYKPDLVSVNANAADVDSLAVQHGLAKTWAEIDPQTEVRVVRTVEEAVAWCREVAGGVREVGEANGDGGKGEVMVLVTGSLHLVGGALEVLESGRRE